MPLPSGVPYAVFKDVESAMAGVNRLGRDLAGGTSILEAFDRLRRNGALHTSVPRAYLDVSASGREISVYGYDAVISHRDRCYLANRDTTIRLFVEGQALDAVSELPVTPASPDADIAIRDLADKGLASAFAQAVAYGLRDGFSFLYFDCPGNVEQPIPPTAPGGARASITPAGFSVITAEQLVWPEPAIYVQPGTPETRDPLLRHGILSLTVDFGRPPDYDWQQPPPPIPSTSKQPGQDSIFQNRKQIHGHRIFPITPDILAKAFVGRSVIDIIYDDLRNLRDTLFAQTAAQLQGNPIVVEVKTDEGFRAEPEDQELVNKDLKEFSEGQRDSFSPLNGMTMKRLGPVELPDAEILIRTLASRLSHASALPVNKILASSRGSEQATPVDHDVYETNLTRRFRKPRLEPVLRHALRIMAHGGAVGKRIVYPTPRFEWLDNRVVAPDTAALIIKNKATTLGLALKAGRLPPRDILEMFPENVTPINPRTVLGSHRLPFDRREDGSPVPDPAPPQDPQSEYPPPPKPAAKASKLEALSEIDEAIAELEAQREAIERS